MKRFARGTVCALVVITLSPACSDGGSSDSGSSDSGSSDSGFPGGASSSAGSGGISAGAGASAGANAGGALGEAGSKSGAGGDQAGAATWGAGAGGAATGGMASAGAAGNDGDLVPPRPLNVTASKGLHSHNFLPKDADPTVTLNNSKETAAIDTRAAKLMGKLVLPFGGVNSLAGYTGGVYNFCVARGFHVLAVAAYEQVNVLINDPAFYGDARKEEFDGIEHTNKSDLANVRPTPAFGVAQRTQKALQYLDSKFPEEGWGFYLQGDGSVRWSDVVFVGFSHGASNAARFAFLVRASRAISLSGPRDNQCTNMNPTNCGGVVATWFDEKSPTPLDRFYALTGVQDDQHLQHLWAMQKLGYSGMPVDVSKSSPPYDNSHRLVTPGGHQDHCGSAQFKNACNYAFGVPPENANGVGP